MFDTIAHPKQRAFLRAYVELGNIKRAARAAEISRESHYDWRAQSPEYAAAFEIAKTLAGEALEDEAHRRAVAGVAEYVVAHGVVVEYQGKPLKKRRYSDALLTLLLKGNLPDKYRERSSTEITGAGGGPIRHEHEHVNYDAFSDEELAFLERLAEKASQPRSDSSET